MVPADIKRPCRFLRAKAPEEWEQFVDMFRQYTAEVIDAVTEADASMIMEMKGRALDCKALLAAFTTLDPPASHQNGPPTPSSLVP